jgi:hypothetical protein
MVQSQAHQTAKANQAATWGVTFHPPLAFCYNNIHLRWCPIHIVYIDWEWASHRDDTVTWRLEAGIVERTEAVVARQQQSTPVSMDTSGQQPFPWTQLVVSMVTTQKMSKQRFLCGPCLEVNSFKTSRQRGRPTETRPQSSDSNIPTGSNIWSQVPQGCSIPRHTDWLTSVVKELRPSGITGLPCSRGR